MHIMKDISEISGIKSWAEDDRPREKLIRKGRQALSDAELIAILLGSGTRSLTAVDVAKQVLATHKNKLNQLGRLGIDDFKKFPGIGEAKAITIIAALELGRRRRSEERLENAKISSSRDIYALLAPKLVDLDHEEFHILLLSRSHKVKDQICISRGGISGTVVDQRLIFKPALEKLASAIVLCHNHPSGTLRPSEQDKRLTQKLVKSGTILDIPILDHLIFTDEGYYSFADEGLL
jgi:DNA repair protein RadC